MSKKIIFLTVLAALISGSIVFLGFTPKENTTPREVYRVYLAGESIGLIESKDELEKYIDQEQSHLKEEYKVDKVYAPKDLDIVSEYTYDTKISSAEEIYNKIKDLSPFTISGYRFTIGGVEETTEEGETSHTEDQHIYVLEKEIFMNAVDKTIRAFVPSDEYDAFLNEDQDPIVDTGKIIEDVYPENNITSVQENIPVSEKIYTSEEELSKYLLFGTLEAQETYIVQPGDNIADVAFANKISTEEFLIANTSIKSAQELLYPGQQVTIGILKPQFKTVEEDHVVQRMTVDYETKYEDDPTQYVGYEKVKQEGQTGVRLVTQKLKKVNGETLSVVTVESKEEKPTVDRIVIRGTKQRTYTNSGTGYNVVVPVEIGSWVWPTKSPYTITSPFSYRWGKLHKGIDISGTGYGSPIRAANNGIVVTSAYNSTNGHYIVVKHSNGYFTEYAHMSRRYKNAGDIVYAGDLIGLMGESGYAFGVHLHFGLWTGSPYTGTPLNPLILY